jgi:hypothetical protein
MPERVATTGILTTECLVFFVLLYLVMQNAVPDEAIQIHATLHATLHYIYILQNSRGEDDRRREGGGDAGGGR